MSRENLKPPAKNSPTPPGSEKKPGSGPPNKTSAVTGPPTPAPLYRRIDWITFAITTILVFVGYYFTLAPDLTLEDSGELAVGSFYAGVPHPPGYPVWTLYTWLFTVLVPFSNIAWRVALSSAVAGAISCGLIALMVSRGSSMIIEGIAELKTIDRRRENAICVVAGFVAGALMGFNGYMWSQAVIVEVYTFSVLSLVGVLVCLLHWIYVPNRRRYLYAAFFLFGICFTNHMTLVLAAMGIEILIAAAQPKLGRDLFLANSIVYLIGLILKAKGTITTFDSPDPERISMLFVIYNFIGLGSIAACGWLTIKTKQLLTEWLPLLILFGCWLLGTAFYFYMPLASMTNPPMNWGYPRTWDGFIHAFTRGQYEKTNPTDLFRDPLRFKDQLAMLLDGAFEEYNPAYLLIGLLPFLFYRRMQKRERAWLIGLSAIYLCLSVLMIILLNPNSDRQTRGLTKVFFTASHVIISMGIGYGLTLIAAAAVMQYQRYRAWMLYGGAVASAIALYGAAVTFHDTHLPLTRFAAVFVLAVMLLLTFVVLFSRNRAPVSAMLALFAAIPVYSAVSHWSDNEQRGHIFGYWFGHDMFTPPFNVYPEMGRDAILFGGTDPGRFCPTYMIFCESFIPPRCKPKDPKFDRRDVYIITQNALADGTYLEYIRAHYNRSDQRDTPFFQEMLRGQREREKNLYTNALARAVAPLDRFLTERGARIEARRRAEGVYPKKEIHTPTVEESQRSFTEYMQDAARRRQLGQLKPGEDVREDRASGKVSVSGQVAVMQINGLLTKIIFDANPESEFYVEESFPLDWMYPYLTPFGIIMKINRQPVPEITEDIIKKDHEFWSKYSERLIGNWITYDTSISNICAFAEKTFLRRDLNGFQGDPKFVRDDDAQKAFSKLRSSIGGVYSWRLGLDCPAAYRPKTAAEQQLVLREADFAYRQAFAFCPFSPEAVFRYVNLLASTQRIDDALLIAATCRKLDPYNTTVANLVAQLENIKQGRASTEQLRDQLGQLEQRFAANPTNLSNALNLFYAYFQTQQTNQAIKVLDQLTTQPSADVSTLVTVASAYAQLGHAEGLLNALLRLVKLMPDNPEAWYDLAGIQATLGKAQDAIRSLTRALQLSNDRLSRQPEAKDLAAIAAKDTRFAGLRGLPEFQRLLSGKP